MRPSETVVADPHPALTDPGRVPLADRLAEPGRWPDWGPRSDRWARRADERYQACTSWRACPEAPADVLRLGVKDTVDVAGFPTTLGLRRYRRYPDITAAVLRGLPASRFVTTAKVVATELNIGVGSGCGNPWFPDVDPAGSSTGSAVAVTAGICDLSLGTDVLGSVRWPAGRCGAVGLRMTHDPARLEGIFPLSPSMDAPGWITRTVADLDTVWSRLGLGGPVGDAATEVLVPTELAASGLLDPEITDLLITTSELARQAGLAVGTTELGRLWDTRGDAWQLCAADAWAGFQRWGAELQDDLTPSTHNALRVGRDVSAADADRLRRAQAEIRSDVGTRFAGSRTVWLLPLDPGVPRSVHQGAAAPAADASTIPHPADPDYEREVGFTPIASFSGLPAITLPVATARQGTAPLAVQLVGPPGSEPVLIATAALLERQRGPLEFRIDDLRQPQGSSRV